MKLPPTQYTNTRRIMCMCIECTSAFAHDAYATMGCHQGHDCHAHINLGWASLTFCECCVRVLNILHRCRLVAQFAFQPAIQRIILTKDTFTFVHETYKTSSLNFGYWIIMEHWIRMFRMRFVAFVWHCTCGTVYISVHIGTERARDKEHVLWPPWCMHAVCSWMAG